MSVNAQDGSTDTGADAGSIAAKAGGDGQRWSWKRIPFQDITPKKKVGRWFETTSLVGYVRYVSRYSIRSPCEKWQTNKERHFRGVVSKLRVFFRVPPKKIKKVPEKCPSSPILDYFILGRPIFKGEVLGLGRVVAPSLCQRTSGQVHQMSWHIFHMDSKGDAPTPRIKISLFTVTGWGGVLMDNPKMAQQMSERHRMSTLWSCALLASFEP